MSTEEIHKGLINFGFVYLESSTKFYRRDDLFISIVEGGKLRVFDEDLGDRSSTFKNIEDLELFISNSQTA